MAKSYTIMSDNGVELIFPAFLDRSDPEVAALVDKGRAAFHAERRASSELRAAEAVSTSKLAAAAKKVIKETPDNKSKDTKPVAKPEKAVRATKSAISPDAILTVLVDSFPHRAGSQAEAKSALLKTGMTVAEYQKAGSGLGLKGNWHLAHIKYCVNYNLIKVS